MHVKIIFFSLIICQCVNVISNYRYRTFKSTHTVELTHFWRAMRYCHDVRRFVCPSISLSVWDGHALWSYGALIADLSLWLDSPCMFWMNDDIKACPPTPSCLFQFHLEERWGIDKCKLDVISQERLKIEVKLLWVLIGSHICRIDWHNNR